MPTSTEPTTALPRSARVDLLIVQVLVVVIGVVVAGLHLGSRLLSWISDEPLTWTSAAGRAGPVVAGRETDPGVSVHYADQAVWSQEHASAGRWLLALLPEILQAVVIVAAAVLLWKVIAKVRLGDPFDRHTVGLVGGLAGLVLGSVVIIPVVDWAVAALLTMSSQLVPSYEFSIPAGALSALLPACAVLVLSYAWRAGNRLRTDADGLI